MHFDYFADVLIASSILNTEIAFNVSFWRAERFTDLTKQVKEKKQIFNDKFLND